MIYSFLENAHRALQHLGQHWNSVIESTLVYTGHHCTVRIRTLSPSSIQHDMNLYLNVNLLI